MRQSVAIGTARCYPNEQAAPPAAFKTRNDLKKTGEVGSCKKSCFTFTAGIPKSNKDSTPRKFNSSPLKNDGWKMSFLLGLPIFRGYMLDFRGVCSSFFWGVGIWIP